MVGTRARYLFGDERSSSLSETMKIGAFADLKENTFEPPLIIPHIPFSKLFTEKVSPDKHTEDSVRNDNESKDSSKTEEDNKQKEERCRTKEEKSKTKDEGENGNPSSPTLASRLGSLTMTSTNDDFIMVDLKTPFASTTEKSELGKFYREWQSAPPLQTFVDIPPLEDLDLTKQLEIFESDLKQYDTFLQSLCQSPNNN